MRLLLLLLLLTLHLLPKGVGSGIGNARQGQVLGQREAVLRPRHVGAMLRVLGVLVLAQHL